MRVAVHNCQHVNSGRIPGGCRSRHPTADCVNKQIPHAITKQPNVRKCQNLSHDLVPGTGGLGLLVAKGEPRNDQLLFLQPFDARLWVTLLGTAFAAALVLKLLSLYTPLGDRQDPGLAAITSCLAPQQLRLYED